MKLKQSRVRINFLRWLKANIKSDRAVAIEDLVTADSNGCCDCQCSCCQCKGGTIATVND